MSRTRPFVCPPVCDVVSTTKVCPISMKFGIETLYKMLINLYPKCSYFFANFGEILCRISPCNAVKPLQVS